MMNRQKALRLPNYIKRFGVANGVRIGLAVGTPSAEPSSAASAIRVPGYDQPVWLRPTRSDHSIFWQCMTRDQYDLREWPQTKALLARRDALVAAGKTPIIIDGGANIGLAAIGFARDFPEARILAVEPDEDNFRVLSQNANATGETITPVLGAISAHAGHSRVIERERGSAGFRTEYCDAGHAEAVASFDIPALVDLVPGGWPWIVKLDIEGAQEELFSANTGWVGDADLIILELDDWQFPWRASAQSFFAALAAHKFDYLIRGELIFCYRHTDTP
jgi:FkbM family methyltransferase